MTLDVETPKRPALSTGVAADEYDDAEVQGDEYRREELAEALDAGAWEDAFEKWAADASLDTEQWEIVTDLGLIEEFDFFWDSFAGRVGYHAPGLPEDWRERDIPPAIYSWGTVSGINAGLTEFGQVVWEGVSDEGSEWEAGEGGTDDLTDF
jgi:hypothetical protein